MVITILIEYCLFTLFFFLVHVGASMNMDMKEKCVGKCV